MGEQAASERQVAEREFDSLRLRLTAGDAPTAQRNDAKVFILTSRTRGEGVTTITRGLAQSFARSGESRVLLLEALAGRGGSPAKAAPNLPQAARSEPARINGNGALVKRDEEESRSPLLASIRKGGDGSIDLLSLPSMGGQEVPSQPAWQDDYSELRTRYDIILVDAGALDSRAPYYWAKGSDHVLLVVDSERTAPETLKRLAKELKTAKLSLTGVVMNKRNFPIPKWLYG